MGQAWALLFATAALTATACDQGKKGASIKGHAEARTCGHGMAFPKIPAGTEVFLTTPDGTRRATTKLDETEKFEFRGLAAGTYTVTLGPTQETDLFHPYGVASTTVEVHAGTTENATLTLCVRPNN